MSSGGDAKYLFCCLCSACPFLVISPYPECCIYKFFAVLKIELRTSGGKVHRNPPANGRDMSSTPGPGRFHTPRSNEAPVPRLPSLCSDPTSRSCWAQATRACKRSHCNEKPQHHNEGSPYWPQSEKVQVQQQRPQPKKRSLMYHIFHTFPCVLNASKLKWIKQNVSVTILKRKVILRKFGKSTCGELWFLLLCPLRYSCNDISWASASLVSGIGDLGS